MQSIQIEESVFEGESFVNVENEFSNNIKVSTHKSLFHVDLFVDFRVLNYLKCKRKQKNSRN